jgi:hypothetical protein
MVALHLPLDADAPEGAAVTGMFIGLGVGALVLAIGIVLAALRGRK